MCEKSWEHKYFELREEMITLLHKESDDDLNLIVTLVVIIKTIGDHDAHSQMDKALSLYGKEIPHEALRPLRPPRV